MKTEIPTQQRISKSTGRLMLLFAVFFDLFPTILIFLAIAISIYSLGGVGVLEDIADSFGGNVIDDWWNRSQVVYKTGAYSATAILELIFIGPLIYTIGSFVATIFAFLVFIPWFYLKGVNMLSFSKSSRILANGLSALIESVPVLNLLPGITFMVWRHIKITQMEDKIKNFEVANKTLRAIKS